MNAPSARSIRSRKRLRRRSGNRWCSSPGTRAVTRSGGRVSSSCGGRTSRPRARTKLESGSSRSIRRAASRTFIRRRCATRGFRRREPPRRSSRGSARFVCAAESRSARSRGWTLRHGFLRGGLAHRASWVAFPSYGICTSICRRTRSRRSQVRAVKRWRSLASAGSGNLSWPRSTPTASVRPIRVAFTGCRRPMP
jgi:hypothetical protein